MLFSATRLAPSPTGALHLGHARTFLLTWLIARQSGAKLYMRMEDLDPGRAKSESVQQAYDDLHWLGLDWDECPPSTTDPATPVRPTDLVAGTVVQSHRLDIYQSVLQTLVGRRLAYPCTCSRADIAATVNSAANAPHQGETHPRYPGTCRSSASPCAESVRDTARRIHSLTGKPTCFRLHVPDAPTTFHDLIAGSQSFNVSADSGDFPLTRFTLPPPSPVPPIADSPIQFLPPAYQLACVTDDHSMAIDLVIRGDDLLPSTPRQLLLYHALGWTPPTFAHIPLVLGPDLKRLAKRHGESRIAQFRTAGLSPQQLLGWAAWRSGQLENPEPLTPQQLLATFDLKKIPKTPIILTQEDLAILR